MLCKPYSIVGQAMLDPFCSEEPKKFIATVAEWSDVPFSTHDLGRTFLSHATAVNISLPVQKELVNHSRKNDVTDGYIQIDPDTLRDAAEKSKFLFCLGWGRYPKSFH